MLVDFCLPIKDEEIILKANALRLYNFLISWPVNCRWRIVILVNGSTDASFQIAKNLVRDYPAAFKAVNYTRGGKSLALKKYFESSEADILSFMDMDLAIDLKNIPDLINPLINNEADLVIGSRLLPKSQTGRSALRESSSHNFNRLARLLFNNKVTDLQCGFKAFKKNLFSHLQQYFQDDRWFFDAELIFLTLKFKYLLKEIPVNWQDNRFYNRPSKVRKSEAWYFVKKLFEFKKYLEKI